MQPVELFTRDGSYVTTVHVPPFQTPPEVIVWGLRIFVLDREAGKYREAFAYAVPLQEF